jgi:glycosyltransferase involved in cell wall biosynthesis
MKIVHIVPGSGGTFYCQNCLRDSALVAALRRAGHDVVLVPMYLPIAADGTTAAGASPVFYGAVSLYLKQNLPWLRGAPAWLERWLNAPSLLRWAAGKAGSTRATGLADMTVSMLRGEDGNQAAELTQLLTWLKAEGRPDVIHLSNALLLGLARRIRRELAVPVLCTLQDEDSWVDAMEPAAAERVWSLMCERAADVDAWVAVSRYYADKMQARLHLPPERVHVVHVGIDLAGYARSALPLKPPVIGFLSRLSAGLGLAILADAVLRLKQEPDLQDVQLWLTGGQTADDVHFLRGLRKRFAAIGAAADLRLEPLSDRAGRLRFLQGLTVLSVPVPAGEAFGTYQIEALAAGVPIVQPRVGAFPEIVAQTGGGVLCEPNTPENLAAVLASLLRSPQRLRELADRGHAAVIARFGIATMAESLVRIYGETQRG